MFSASRPGSRTTSTCSTSDESRIAAAVQQQIEEYRYQELKKREERLQGKLDLVREQLVDRYPASLLVNKQHLMASSASLNSVLSADQPASEEDHQHGFLALEDINEQEARTREKNIIEFETTRQGAEEGLAEFVERLQHCVVAAYGSEPTETLQRRVAWAFIRGLRDHNVRSFVVAAGWTKSNTETLSPRELLELANMVRALCTFIL